MKLISYRKRTNEYNKDHLVTKTIRKDYLFNLEEKDDLYYIGLQIHTNLITNVKTIKFTRNLLDGREWRLILDTKRKNYLTNKFIKWQRREKIEKLVISL